MNKEAATKITEEMVKETQLSEQTEKIVRYTKFGIGVIAGYGSTKIIKGLTDAVVERETNRLKRGAIRLGGFIMDFAIAKVMDDLIDTAADFTLNTIKGFKAYKNLVNTMEETYGSDTESESDEE